VVQGAGLDVDHGTQGAALNAGAVRNEGSRGKDDISVGRIVFQNVMRVAERERELFPSGGVAFRRIGDEGLKGESDVRRCPPTLHTWVPSSHQESRERRFDSRKRLRKIDSCSS
jgi:hypothetical protein